MAGVLGRVEDAERYEVLAREIRGAFQRAFHDVERGDYAPGTQCSNALALRFGLVEEGAKAGVLESILEDLRRHNGHFTVGVLGAKYLLEALTEQGRPEVAYVLATKQGYPSWAHLIEGRTTLSEFWDLRGSHNHVMLGSVDAWFYRTLAGIQPDEVQAGFERFRIQPYVPRALGWVRAKVRTVRGDVKVSWEQRPEELQLQVSVPPNAMAVVRVPCPADRVVRVSPQRMAIDRDGEAVEYHVGSGEYRFRVVPVRRSR
jgi:alpha-L-rhamnosidase